jgi:hypothetical protein
MFIKELNAVLELFELPQIQRCLWSTMEVLKYFHFFFMGNLDQLLGTKVKVNVFVTNIFALKGLYSWEHESLDLFFCFNTIVKQVKTGLQL